jgi:transitional endoplasmic reticulum ATPase
MPTDKKISAIQLKVGEASQRDVGKGRARVELETMEALALRAGDVIEIVGKESTVATVWPADNDSPEKGIVRIDGQTRKNAGVALNEYATIRRVDAGTARSITLAPVSTKMSVDREFAEFVRNRLRGLAVSEGDDVSVVILGSPMVFTVQKIRPKPIGRIEQGTHLSILAEPVSAKKPGPSVTYEEIGGLKEEIRRLREIVELPLKHPEVFQRLGVDPPNGILLHGPPGCGKTLLARALATESEANFYTINGPEVMNKYYGETEAKLREIFKEAKEKAPGIIFIDEIDALAPKREEVFGDVEKRVVAQILALMDGISARGDVVVIGATNRPDDVDPALRRPGRFDREVEVGVPNAEGRYEILQIHTRGMPIDSDVDLKKMANELHGYTGADLRALCREAALKALRRCLPELEIQGEKVPPSILETMTVTSKDFREASKEIVPTAMREVYVEYPSVDWTQVGGMEEVKQTINENVIMAIKHPEQFAKVGVKPPRGILMFGPSGCGKTLLARAIATESGANFITVKGPEVLSKWLGESEKAIREIFRKAKVSAPCIVFFDEIDSIATPRGMAVDEFSYNERVLSQLLTEIDDSYSLGDIFVIGATNRPDLVDISLLRPGRLDLLIYVPPPDERTRLEILKIQTAKMPVGKDISLEEIAASTKGYSGADIESLCREAGIQALRRNPSTPVVGKADFFQASRLVRASITQEVENWYSNMQKQLRSSSLRYPEKTFSTYA